MTFINVYFHLSNKRGNGNKSGGGAKVAKSLNVDWDFFLEKTVVHNCNKRGIESRKKSKDQL